MLVKNKSYLCLTEESLDYIPKNRIPRKMSRNIMTTGKYTREIIVIYMFAAVVLVVLARVDRLSLSSSGAPGACEKVLSEKQLR